MKLFLFVVLSCLAQCVVQASVDKPNREEVPSIRKLKLADANQLGLAKSFNFQIHLAKGIEKKVDDYIDSRLVEDKDLINIDRQVLVRHFFIPLGQRISSSELHSKQRWVDSLFQELQEKQTIAFFEELIAKHSEIKKPYWCNYLEETSEFKHELESLDFGIISEPFITARGIHIVQKVEEKSKPVDQLSRSEKLLLFKDVLGVHENEEAISELLYLGRTDKVLLQTPGKSYQQIDFDQFSEGKSLGKESLWRDFSIFVLAEEIKEVIGTNPTFRNFTDSLLLAEVYDYRVKSKIKENQELLLNYFEDNRSLYNWEEPQFKGLVVFCKNRKVRRSLHKELNNEALSNWEKTIENNYNKSSLQVLYEIGEYTLGDNSYVDYYVFKKGKRIRRRGFPRTRVYGEIIKGPKTIDSVYDSVYADYSLELEKEWEINLIKAYKKGNLTLSF